MDKLDKLGELTEGINKLKGAAEGFTADLTSKLDADLVGYYKISQKVLPQMQRIRLVCRR